MNAPRTELIIRDAVEEDVASILKILNYEIVHSTSLYEYDERTLEFQLDWFQKKKKHHWPVIVAELNGDVVGLGTFGTFRERIAYRFTVEHSIYISSEARNAGIGKSLMMELIRLAKEGGYHSMIGGIDANNEGSIRFHEKFGFVEVARMREVGFKFDRWLDLVFMQLVLDR